MREIQKIISSLLISTGIVLLGLFASYILFGTCGYINAGNAIKQMNKIHDGWKSVRETAVVQLSNDGNVSFETLEIMQDWRNYLFDIKVPACLDDAYVYLDQATQSDFDVLSTRRTDISNGNKLEMIKWGEDRLRLYEQSSALIDVCIPTCNYQMDYEFVLLLISDGPKYSIEIYPSPTKVILLLEVPTRTPVPPRPKPHIAGETNSNHPLDEVVIKILDRWLLNSAPVSIPYWFVTYWDQRDDGYVVSLAAVNLSYPEEHWSLVDDPNPKVVWIGTVEIFGDTVRVKSGP